MGFEREKTRNSSVLANLFTSTSPLAGKSSVKDGGGGIFGQHNNKSSSQIPSSSSRAHTYPAIFIATSDYYPKKTGYLTLKKRTVTWASCTSKKMGA